MTYKWTEWEKISKQQLRDPYIHWSVEGPGEDRINEQDETDLQEKDFVLQTLPGRPAAGDRWVYFKNLDQIAVPKLALNPDANGEIAVKRPDPDNLPSGEDSDTSTPIADNTVIAGVIDVGMPLGHRRLRFANGRTRILSAWQMVGNWNLNPQCGIDVPFGCAFYESEINENLKAFSDEDLQGHLDEDAFHKQLGILNFSQVNRQTALAKRASHGAHVLDMVAGAATHDADNFAERVRIIAVNAPSSAIFGASGTYLDSYMLHAIQHIADVADGIWAKRRAAGACVPEDGFPIVINLSFGKHAGSNDIYDRFAAALIQFQKERTKDTDDTSKKAEIRFVMPTGNDNLERCNAVLVPEKDEDLPLDWRIQPQDQSSNYTEVWFKQPDLKKKKQQPAIRLSLSAPCSSEQPLDPPRLKKRETWFCNLNFGKNVVASLYVTRAAADNQAGTKNASPEDLIRFRYVLCVAPTYRVDGNPSMAASGVWTISTRNCASDPILVTLSIQTDQGLTPSRTINRRSYFDDSGYQTYDYDRDGRLLESYSYPKNTTGTIYNRDIEANTPVRRHGTMNASAAHKAVARVGGYRASDGRPAFYSATGRGQWDGSDMGMNFPVKRNPDSRRAPTAAFSTDDGPAHGGILSAGSADGSRVVMRGTSFAASQASRHVIDAILSGNTMQSASEIL